MQSIVTGNSHFAYINRQNLPWILMSTVNYILNSYNKSCLWYYRLHKWPVNSDNDGDHWKKRTRNWNTNYFIKLKNSWNCIIDEWRFFLFLISLHNIHGFYPPCWSHIYSVLLLGLISTFFFLPLFYFLFVFCFYFLSFIFIFIRFIFLHY